MSPRTVFYDQTLWRHHSWPVTSRKNKILAETSLTYAACHELAVDYKQLRKVLYVFGHEMHDISIHAPYTSIVVFWHNIYEILLYNRHLVAITHELIYIVRAAHR